MKQTAGQSERKATSQTVRNSNAGQTTAVKPFRMYEVVRDRNGDLLAFQLSLQGHPRPNASALIAEGTEITREEISNWLKGISFTANDNEELYFIINLFRVTVHPRDAVPDNYPYKRVQAALKALETDVPLAINDLEAIYLEKKFLSPAVARIETQLAELRQFSRAVARIRIKIRDDTPPVHHKFQSWHNDALFLAYTVRMLAPDGSLKSISSPLIRFVTLALNRAVPLKRARSEDKVRQALSAHPQRCLLGFS